MRWRYRPRAGAECDDWVDATARGDPIDPSPQLADYLDALDRHRRDNYGAQVIPVHKLWTSDGWLLTPQELTVALSHAPEVALDRRQRRIPWWRAVAGLPRCRPRPRRRPRPLTSTNPAALLPAPQMEEHALHGDRVTVTDLIQHLEDCDPDAEVCLAQQPTWPFEYAIDPTNPAVQVDLDEGPVVYLAEGAQLGYLPSTSASSSAGDPPPATAASGALMPQATGDNGRASICTTI